LLIGLKLTPTATSNRHKSRIDDIMYRLLRLEGRVRTLEKERENDQRTIMELQDEISSRKRRNESGDQADKKLEEEPRKSRKCRHLGAWEEPIVLELRGEEICLRTGHVKLNYSR
jgi:TolA-binding protein